MSRSAASKGSLCYLNRQINRVVELFSIYPRRSNKLVTARTKKTFKKLKQNTKKPKQLSLRTSRNSLRHSCLKRGVRLELQLRL
jgi:hypothetical protein